MKTSRILIFSKISYLILVLFNLFMAYFLRNYFNIIFLAILLIAPIIALSMAFLLRGNLTVTFDGATYVDDRNEEFVCNIHFKNSSICFANNAVATICLDNTTFNEKSSHTVTIPINPLSKTSISYPIRSSHSGVLNVTVSEIVIYDLFNIFHFTKKLDKSHDVVILPSPSLFDEEFDMDLSEGLSESEETSIKGFDSSEISDIREYIPGDRLSDIHWKLSAKKSILMVKERISLSSNQLFFFIELAKCDEATTLDLILDTAYSLGLYLRRENLPYSFMWYSMAANECKSHLILTNDDLTQTIIEILYETPYENREEVLRNIPAMSGHSNFITIGVDYVLNEEKD